ncbi:hypothetical protein Acr_05g0016070 [Actinidia rufa]|uniref:Transposase (putative) gypsy type domain-containing protein n=1 Tax=Actinidia rufa TaxID=165716 RepID=A0A7J0ENB1_9ERIC|nr:hypothetical protein Acr_05g0016070 [Actinidia rufa]
MINEVNQRPPTPPKESSPREKLYNHGEDPGMEVPSSPAMELNTMTQGGLDRLRKAYSFPSGIRTRILENGETILSSGEDEVAYYEAAFPTGLRFPIHPTIKQILNFYDICPAQLSPNALRCIIYVLVVWQFYQRHLSLNEFRRLYALLKGSARPPILGEGSAAKPVPGEVLDPQASMMAKCCYGRKKLARVILPSDKEKVEKLTFDQVRVILGSSLAVRSRDFAESTNNQRALSESSELKMVRAQNRVIKLEGALAEVSAKEKKAAEEIKAMNKKVARMEAWSSYFGDGFDFCKRQLAHHHPNLGIDLDDIDMDQEFLKKEEAEAKERERKEAEEREEEKKED